MSPSGADRGTMAVMYLRRPAIDAIAAGATTGLLAQVLVMRLNPEVVPDFHTVALGALLWMSWGALWVGVPGTLALLLLYRVRPSRHAKGPWISPTLQMGAFLLGAIMSAVNADLHPEYLSGSGCRTLKQDAVAWLVAALLAGLAGRLVHRIGRPPLLRLLYMILVFSMPLSRLVGVPTPLGQPQDVGVQPLGTPSAQLLVVGVEGLDSKVMLSFAAGGRYPTLDRLANGGAWGRLRPYRPALLRAHWTTVATGTLPRRNGVKSHWGWDLPLLFDDTLRLLPWTPEGSRLILPWNLATRVVPPPSTVPPLWQRIAAAGISSTVIDWPGLWAQAANVETIPPGGAAAFTDTLASALALALESFPEVRDEVLASARADVARTRAARRALEAGSDNVWLYLESLSTARRNLEPLHPLDTSQREVLDLVLELVDRQLGLLLGAVDDGSVVAVLSPYGLAPPDSLERIRRLLGGGDDWRSSPESCPDGLLMLYGRGIARDRRVGDSELTDVAPSLCYLLGLPVAQYMDGRLISDAVDSRYLATHPLRVID